MILKLTKISKEDIERDTRETADETSAQIMYLHNNGANNSKWNKDDFVNVLEEDIED